MDPFLPWPGSKTSCSDAIIDEFPERFGTYYEPFLGSGAIFFRMNTKREFARAELSDINANLINCFTAVRDRPEHVKKMLTHCLERNSAEFYETMRRQMHNPSVFIYVMRAAFSSMYRENLKGEFNVPWRRQDFEVKQKRISFNMERLEACSAYMRSKDVTLSVADWMDVCQLPKRGDLVYFDPPYIPFATGGFTDYSKAGFSEGNHVFLRTQARLLSERGVYVALSNSLTDGSLRIYGEPTKVISVSNSVKATATTKGTRQEGLWVWRAKS